MSGQDFVIEDWWENVSGCSCMYAAGNPAALEYAIRHAKYGDNNNVSLFGNDVVYGKIGTFWHIFHVNELEIELWQAHYNRYMKIWKMEFMTSQKMGSVLDAVSAALYIFHYLPAKLKKLSGT